MEGAENRSERELWQQYSFKGLFTLFKQLCICLFFLLSDISLLKICHALHVQIPQPEYALNARESYLLDQIVGRIVDPERKRLLLPLSHPFAVQCGGATKFCVWEKFDYTPIQDSSWNFDRLQGIHSRVKYILLGGPLYQIINQGPTNAIDCLCGILQLIILGKKITEKMNKRIKRGQNM